MDAGMVAHYSLKQRLGRGAMGEVWLAEDTRLHREVALKMLPADAADAAGEAASARLLREARVASTLNHPNVAVVYDVGEGERDGRPARFVAMELVRGRTLAELLADGPLAPEAVLDVARQAAAALAEAHARGIVHRDVKPGNVMVGDDGRVKVLDFGLAAFSPPAAEDSATWSGAHDALGAAGLAGTLAYMSPEQLRGAPVDGRSDGFSLGVVLYELLCGRRPFRADNAIALVDAILHGVPEPLTPPGALGQGLAALVEQLLQKDAARRPADLRVVCRELEALAEGRSAAAAGLAAQPAEALAVTAFANLTARAEDAWLATALAETLTAGLAASLPGTSVLSRERALEAARALRLAEGAEGEHAVRIGRELAVGRVVSGAFQCSGEQVRVTASVTETASGRVLHTVKLDGTRAGIFELQDALLARLGAALRGVRSAAPAADETHSLEAYEAFAKGLVNLQAESPEALDRAIAFFEQAIALDPAYARAHAQLGAALDVKGDYLGVRAVSQRAVATLEHAVALRPELAESWRQLGAALITVGRADDALAAFDRALSLDPTQAAAHSGIGRVHFVLRGDFAAAIPAYERALALNPRAGWTALQLANCAAYVRDFERAERAARLAIELQRAVVSGRAGLVIVGGWVRLGQCRALQGRHAEALGEFEHELEFLRGVDHALRARIFIELQQRIGAARLALGERDAGLAALDLAVEAYERRVRSGAADPATPYYVACAQALRGERDAALAALESAAALRPRLTAARAAVEPALAGLKGDSRFAAILDAAKR